MKASITQLQVCDAVMSSFLVVQRLDSSEQVCAGVLVTPPFACFLEGCLNEPRVVRSVSDSSILFTAMEGLERDGVQVIDASVVDGRLNPAQFPNATSNVGDSLQLPVVVEFDGTEREFVTENVEVQIIAPESCAELEREGSFDSQSMLCGVVINAEAGVACLIERGTPVYIKPSVVAGLVEARPRNCSESPEPIAILKASGFESIVREKLQDVENGSSIFKNAQFLLPLLGWICILILIALLIPSRIRLMRNFDERILAARYDSQVSTEISEEGNEESDDEEDDGRKDSKRDSAKPGNENYNENDTEEIISLIL